MEKLNPYSKKNWPAFRSHILRQWYLLQEEELDECKTHEEVAALVSKRHSQSYELALEGVKFLEALVFRYPDETKRQKMSVLKTVSL